MHIMTYYGMDQVQSWEPATEGKGITSANAHNTLYRVNLATNKYYRQIRVIEILDPQKPSRLRVSDTLSREDYKALATSPPPPPKKQKRNTGTPRSKATQKHSPPLSTVRARPPQSRSPSWSRRAGQPPPASVRCFSYEEIGLEKKRPSPSTF